MRVGVPTVRAGVAVVVAGVGVVGVVGAIMGVARAVVGAAVFATGAGAIATTVDLDALAFWVSSFFFEVMALGLVGPNLGEICDWLAEGTPSPGYL